ncbi:hypothetical protein [Mycobacterium sp. 29Ha]|uniref:hypothetical protein n=1 Tax=Mycobacterium sp. 29Ha TaxID=2939268 RepID=UPI0029391664|nr:hypothetical protein [Mycobacterium sp. 29Ha]MDV3134260.1 hypothetical protein [Mycobacterium sp. 29Ha]
MLDTRGPELADNDRSRIHRTSSCRVDDQYRLSDTDIHTTEDRKSRRTKCIVDDCTSDAPRPEYHTAEDYLR